jgi:hypothetical protein
MFGEGPGQSFEERTPSTWATPGESLDTKEQESSAEEFVSRLCERLDDDSRVILAEILYPRSPEEIPEEYIKTVKGDEPWRKPRKYISRHVLADILGLPRIRVRRAVKKIKKAATQVAQELELNSVAQVGLDWLAKRKHRGELAEA